MKRFTFCVFLAAFAISTTAVAQKKKTTPKSSAAANGWQSISLQWNPSSFVPEKGDSQSFTGFSALYSKAFSISRTSPLYIEAGAGLQYSSYSEDITAQLIDDDYSYYHDEETLIGGAEKFSMLSLKIPVNITYKWDIPNSTVSLLPYAGLTLRYNISGKVEYEYDDPNAADEEYDVFKSSDMGGNKYTWNRFQLGWQIGVNARFNNTFYAGLAYGQDLSEISKKVKISTASITVGYCF